MHATQCWRWLVVFLTSVALFAGCRKATNQEAAIRAVLDEGVVALDKQDLARAMALLSPSYRDKMGRDVRQMKGIGLFVTRRGPVTVGLRDVTIRVEGSTATVTTTAYALQDHVDIKNMGDVIPGARKFDLTITLVEEKGDWKVRAIDGDGTSGGGWE